jgi:hypothetical protein
MRDDAGMLARSDSLTTLPTPAQVAAGVVKPAALKVAELNIRRLNELREKIIERQRALIAGSRHRENEGTRMSALERERLEIERQIGAARRAAGPLRETYAKEVERVLMPIVLGAADRIVKLLEELKAEIAAAHECHLEAMHAGGAVPMLPGLPSAGFELAARELAKLGGRQP